VDKKDRLEAYPTVLFGLSSDVRYRAERKDRLEAYPTVRSEVRTINSLKAGNEKRERDREPDKEGRVVRVIAAVVVTAAIISAAPVASALAAAGVVSVTAVVVAVIIPVVVTAAAGMNGSMTSMSGAGLRGSNAEEGDYKNTQRCYGFHLTYYNSVARSRTLGLFVTRQSKEE
jgi:hypothetical protein